MGNSKYRILVCDTIAREGLDLFTNAGFEVTYLPNVTKKELIGIIGEYDAIIVRSRTKVTSEVISAAKKLKVIGRAGVGLDNIDLEAVKARGIDVQSTPEALTNAVAEMVIGLMLSLSRSISQADASIKDGRWLKNELIGHELRGKTLGIVGMGRIGSTVGRLAKAFGMKILAYDIVKVDEKLVRELDAEVKELNALLAEADYVTLHVPFTDQTYHLIGDAEIRRMKRSAYLINTSRGAVVDEEALYNALKNKVISGAALDVFEVEPPTSSKLIKLPSVVCTPHIGGQTEEAQSLAAILLSEKIIKVLSKLDKFKKPL